MLSNLLPVESVMSNIKNDLLRFTVALSHEAHEIAEQSIRGITSRVKAKQVYANTLAVYAANHYFQCLGFNPDWQHSNSRNPLLIQLTNVADLEIKDVGKVECIPVLADAATDKPGQIPEFQIPPESENERVGYMPVEINDDLTQATILGFSTQKSGGIKLTELRDLEYAIEYLTDLEQPALVRLRDWLNGLVDSTLEPLDRILNPNQLRLRYRGAVNGGQKIELHTPTGVVSSALVIDVKSTEASEALNVLVQVYPREHNELPDGIKLTISDDTQTTMTAISKSGDNWIQLNFTAMFDEEFTVTVGLGDAEVLKKFVV
jgi:hypothetical protein